MQSGNSSSSNQGVAPQPSEQQQEQTSTRGRGRGRGTRGRGGGATRPTVNPTVPHVITRLVNGCQPIIKPENSYYVINLVNIVSLFSGFGTYITRLSRRGDWPLGPGYYAGIMLYAFAAKLQRVGIASNQINPPSNHLIQVAGLELPTSIVTLIDQFGLKMDEKGVMIAPLVTETIIATLGRLAFLVTGINCDHTVGNANTALLVDANRFNIMWHAYGSLLFLRLCLANAAARLGIAIALDGVRPIDLNRTAYQMAIEYNVKNTLNVISAPDMLLILPLNVAAYGALTAPFLVGGAAVAAGGTIGANLVAGFNSVLDDHPNGANIFANNDAYVDASSTTQVPGGWDAYYAEQVELAHRFYMSPVSVSPAGSFAPTVVSGGEDQMSGYSVVSGLTATEWMLGLVLGADPTLVTRDGIPFNVSDRVRRKARYSVPPIDMSYDNLTAAFIRESQRPPRV